ncbi:MAG: uroporphyrinogen-III C-methyltransferase, partial [Gammaproteobacteria bacterium]|nr:uroporphyrinogen-III C-methyltransferase [Gammaproteobacteria bacterium]
EFNEADINKQSVVIAATDNREVNELVSLTAKNKGIPVNVVDNPDLCSFIMPSIIDRSPVQIAISTGGASPVLARLLRGRLESFIPSACGRLASIVEEYREAVKKRFSNVDARRFFWERILQGHIAELVYAGHDDEARSALKDEINRADDDSSIVGQVFLVGAGPGDPDLLTFKALRMMQQADVVVYDRLVSEPILDMVRRDAERIYAGKERDNHAIQQEDINLLLIRLAKEGKKVLRLKGGDPFIFGRGGEEIEGLMEEGIPFQVVPAITAASGCSTYSGIPLTHRDYSQACTFVTGHLKDGTCNLNWPALAQPNQTIVFYMGLQAVNVICKELIAHDMPPSTPAALIQQGTTPQQKVYIGDLDSLPELVRLNEIKAPTLIIVGQVVQLHEKLNWYKVGNKIPEK